MKFLIVDDNEKVLKVVRDTRNETFPAGAIGFVLKMICFSLKQLSLAIKVL